MKEKHCSNMTLDVHPKMPEQWASLDSFHDWRAIASKRAQGPQLPPNIQGCWLSRTAPVNGWHDI